MNKITEVKKKIILSEIQAGFNLLVSAWALIESNKQRGKNNLNIIFLRFY